MKLETTTIDFIKNTISAAKLIGLETIIIESDMIRGLTETRDAFILQTENIPTLEFDAMGVTRLDVLNTRLNITDNVNVSASLNDAGWVENLTISKDRTKTEFNCGNPNNISAVKSINDSFDYTIEFTEDDVVMLTKAASSVASDDLVSINSDGQSVSFVLSEFNKDVFKHEFFETPNTFANKYSLKILLSLLKQNTTGEFVISSKGILKINVNGFDFYIMVKAV